MFRIFFTDGSRSTQIPKGAVVWELLVALVYFLVGGYLLSHLTTFAVTSVNSPSATFRPAFASARSFSAFDPLPLQCNR
jgi:hypothetical protein